MQRTVKTLRILLPIVFVGFIALIVMNWTKTRRERDHSTAEPPEATRPEKPIAASQGFEDTQTIAGRVVSRIRAKRVVAYVSNWNTLEGVELTIFRPNGLTYNLVCPDAQFNSQSKEADAKGGVKLTSTDGVEIATAEIHFDGNRLTNHIPVQFKVDRWTGNSGALDLDVAGETLRLFEKLDATMAPAHPGEAPMKLTSQDGVFRRNENDITFTQNVVLTRQADRLNGDRMVGKMTPDRKQLLSMEGQGHIFMAMSSNPATGENLGGRKEITCDRFWSELAPNGTINAINAVGDSGPAHAVLEGPPKRDLVAKTFRVALVGKAVSELKADQQVVMKESGETPRDINADRVTVAFDTATHHASNAYLEGNVKYVDPKNTATAMRANYDIGNDRVLLTADYGFDPTVVADGQTLKAKQIEFSPKAGTAKATGSVIAQLISKPNGVSADATGVFPANKPVFVNSDSLLLRQTTKVAVFTGNVKAWQDNNTMFAQELQVTGAGEQITARGDVRNTMYNATTAGGEVRKTPVVSRSDQLLARKTDRRIDLVGGVKIVDDARTMTSERASFFFDANRKIERVESETKVVLVEQSMNRRGTGDKATYLVAKKMIYVSGNPATVTDPKGNLTGQQIAFDLARNKVEIVSSSSETKGSYKTDAKP